MSVTWEWVSKCTAWRFCLVLKVYCLLFWWVFFSFGVLTWNRAANGIQLKRVCNPNGLQVLCAMQKAIFFMKIYILGSVFFFWFWFAIWFFQKITTFEKKKNLSTKECLNGSERLVFNQKNCSYSNIWIAADDVWSTVCRFNTVIFPLNWMQILIYYHTTNDKKKYTTTQ